MFADDVFDNRQADNALANAHGLSSLQVAVADPLDGCMGGQRGGPADTANIAGTFADGSMEGKLALIRRGVCFFSTKILNAQNAGAVATVIYNDGRPGEVKITGAAFGEMIHTPALFILGTQGDALNAAVTANPDLRVQLRCEEPGPPPSCRDDPDFSSGMYTCATLALDMCGDADVSFSCPVACGTCSVASATTAGGDTACTDEGLVAPLDVRYTKPPIRLTL